MDLKGKKVLVVGTGVSGIGAADLLFKVGAQPIIYDSNEKADVMAIKGKVVSQDIGVILGTLEDDIIENLYMAVLSPGVPTDAEFVNRMRDKGVIIWGELELAYNFAKGMVVAITGTNGKTTTTTLVGEIMKSFFKEVYVVGNIGTPYSTIALDTTEESVTVVEASSFQLETIENFHPHVSAMLNFTPDHLNRHYTMEGYVNAKKNILKNQTAADFVILNYEDEGTRKVGEETDITVMYFSSRQELEEGLFFKDQTIWYRHNGETEKIATTEELKLLGLHNMENIMAAVAMGICLGVPMDKIKETITSFMGVEHRIEYVTEKNGVTYYNDSKGTNTDAAIKAVLAMIRPTVLIGGGYDKCSAYDEWVETFDGRVRELVLLGATKEAIAKCAKEHGFDHIHMVDSFEEAVALCAQLANPGDAVLLSPACASWGMFKNFEERGRVFKELVNQLEG